jgi:hypothetical protein
MTDSPAVMLPPHPDSDHDASLPGWLTALGPGVLPSPTVVEGPPAPDRPITYGIVAKVTLARPGYGFRVEHDLPAGVELIETKPKATVVGEHLIWQLGRLDPGQELRVQVVVKPKDGAKLDPAGLTDFEATYSQNLYFQTPVVQPRLAARLLGPVDVAVGTAAEFVLDVASTGNWVVEGAKATVTLPAQFEHPEGPTFHFELGDVKPGGVRRVTIPANAVAPGPATIRAEVTGPADRTADVELACRVS